MNTKTRMLLLVAATFALSMVAELFAQKTSQPREIMWRPIDEGSVDQSGKRDIVPLVYRTVRLDKEALTQALATAPMEFTRPSTENPIIYLPMPDGTMARFRFEESPVIEAELAAKYPGLNTYRAQGVDDPTATSRFDWLPTGFHATILTPSETVLIAPYAKGNTTDYITYWKKDAGNVAQGFECHLTDLGLPQLQRPGGAVPNVISGTQLRTYRLALAATHEYTVAVDGANSTVVNVLAAEVQVMNAVNAVFEREVAVHMNIIGNNNLITYASDATCGGVPCNDGNDPYTCADPLGQNVTNINAVIGAANYDIGHLFNTCGGGGQAALGSVCTDTGKAAARSGDALPQLPTTLHLVAHEMGHQFNANHSWNGCPGQETQRSGPSGYEPGSGITAMGYAGVCGDQNLNLWHNSLNMFTVKGLEDIIAFTQIQNGNTCASITNSGNTPPNVSVLSPGTWTIPKDTPFTLRVVLDAMRGAEETDDTGGRETYTYDWEEYDLDPSWVAPGVPNSDVDGHARPIFRIYPPTVGLTRTFPSMQYILNNGNVPPATFTCESATCLTGELLPHISRTMQFKVVARDNNAVAGGINTANATVTVDGNAAAFAVTSPNTAIIVQGQAFFTVTWVASGNAANVKISLSTDGGQTFPTILAASTPNDGSQSVLIPNLGVSTARIKIEAVGNIYFDISNVNFTITPNS